MVSAWSEERQAWKKRSLADRDYVYVWADGVHFGVRLEDERVAVLVLLRQLRRKPRRPRNRVLDDAEVSEQVVGPTPNGPSVARRRSSDTLADTRIVSESPTLVPRRHVAVFVI